MKNKLKAMLMGINENQRVAISYKEVTQLVTVGDLLTKVDENSIGDVLDLGIKLTIDSIRRVDGEVVTNWVAADEGVSKLIDSASVVDQITSLIQKKGKGMSHIQITLGVKQVNGVTYTDNKVGFVRIAENLAIRKGLFKVEDSVVLRHGKDSIRINATNKYVATLEILSLCYGGDEEQGRYAIENDLFMSFNNNGSYNFYLKQGSKYYDLESDKEVATSEGMRRYRAFGASPSNDRQSVIYFIDVTNGADRANAVLNELTWGAYKLDFKKKVSYDKLAKLSTRWFQWMAPSISLGTIGRLAVYFGKFDKDKADGMALSSSEAMASHIKETIGYNIKPTALNGVFWQGRPAQTKAGFMNVPEAVVWDIVRSLDSDPIMLDWDQVTPQVISDIHTGKYANRVIVFGNGVLEFLFDKNALKSDYDYSIKPEYTVLRFLHSNNSNFSSTIFQKMVAKDANRATKYAYGLLQTEVFDRMKRAYIEPKARVIAPEKLNENFYMDEVISSIFPTYLKMDQNISLNVLGNVTQAVNKMLQKFKVPMTGRNSGLTVGLEVFFKIESLLGDHEVFCPAAEKMLKKLGTPEENWKVFMIKYPSMDIDEYQIAKVIRRTEMKRRINALNISKAMKGILVNYYCSLHESVLVVPACELFKNMLAGSDFDTDQVCWSIDQELIEILDHDPLAIVIE